MFDTMTFTKVLGAVCGSLLAFLMLGWAAEGLYHVHQHGEASYSIDTGEDDAEEVVEEGPSFEELFAAADAGAGMDLHPREAAPELTEQPCRQFQRQA